MLDTSIQVIDGHVYEITVTKKTREEKYIGEEYALYTELEAVEVNTERGEVNTMVKGVVYKKKYDGELLPITNDIILSLEDGSSIPLSPTIDGVVELDLTFTRIPKKEIQFDVKEESTEIKGHIALGR